MKIFQHKFFLLFFSCFLALSVGYGQTCEMGDRNDPDNDGICNNAATPDNCPNRFNPGQINNYGYTKNPDGSPVTVKDAEGDACDDSDSDGFRDDRDFCPELATNQNLDEDADGVGNACDNCRFQRNPGQRDTDEDGRGDQCDTDDDNDEIDDAEDNCPRTVGPDDEEGDPTAGDPDQGDIDEDGDGDLCDDDMDGDGIDNDDDLCEEIADDESETIDEQPDQDNDGIGDACDDGDEDGVFDDEDNCPGIANADQDNHYPSERDNIFTRHDDFEADDAEGDACDNSDEDTILDIDDNCPETTNQNQSNVDQDDDGDLCDDDDDNDDIDDEDDNCQFVANGADEGVGNNQTDTDDDGAGDACDDDDDNDGIDDDEDNCDLDENGDENDTDEDGDNQGDIDEDETGDACDDDMDGDGIDNEDDNCEEDANEEQFDIDNNGIGDACEEDDDRDNDGVLNFEDNCPDSEGAGASQRDTDGDGDGDVCDDDDDNDGIIDAHDCFPTDGTAPGRRYKVCRNGIERCVTEAQMNDLTNRPPRRRWKLGACGSNQNQSVSPEAIAVEIERAEVSSKVGVSIYPNPTSGSLKVMLQNFRATKAEIMIMNAAGSVVERRSVSVGGALQTETFDLTRKAAGIYLVRVVSEDGVKTSKVVLQR